MNMIGIGDNVIDRYLNQRKIFPGGNAVNVAVHMKKCGVDAAYLGVLADDREGEIIRQALCEEQVEIVLCRMQKGGTTKRCDVNIIDGERQFVTFSLGDNWEKIRQFTREELIYISKFDLIHTSCNAKIEDEICRFRDFPGMVTFDFSTKEKYRTEEFLKKTCPYLELALFSCNHMTQEELEAFAEKIHGMGAGNVVITQGEKGAVFYNGKVFVRGKADLVRPVDTMGAGDSYLASLMAYLLKNGWKKGVRLQEETIRAAMCEAAAYSAANCAVPGGFGHMDVLDSGMFTKEQDWPEIPAQQEISLAEYLWEQVETDRFTRTEQKRLYFIISLLDENTGYLEHTCGEIARMLRISPEETENYIREIKSLEPAGIGAADMRESLLLQAKRKGCFNRLLEQIILCHMEETARGAYGTIARKCRASSAEVDVCVQVIKGLNPRPVQGLPLKGQKEHSIIPDLKAEYDVSQWLISLYETRSFSLVMEPYYSDMARESDDNLVSSYLKEKIGRAQFLAAAIERRRHTLTAVASCLLKAQSEALLNGESWNPLTMEQIAEQTGLHISTVSRAVKDKYIALPGKVIALKHLLAGAEAQKANSSMSREKTRIQQIIASEEPRHPYSDEKITEILEKEGIYLSRRTVAKYRGQMMIAGAKERRANLR